MQKIVLLGGSGFIGTRLCKRLLENESLSVSIIDKVMSSDYPSLTTIADVRLIDELRSSVPSGAVIINLAAEHRDDVQPKSLYDEVNVAGARNVCDIAREKKVERIIFTSSVAIYGFAAIGTDENGDPNPFNDYGRTKLEAESVYDEWYSEEPDSRALFIVRPTVVFGERNRGNVYNLLEKVASGHFIMIGSGENRKSMAYVENIAAFLEFAINSKNGKHVYNYIDKPDMSMNELVRNVNEIIGRGRKTGIRIPYWLGYLAGMCFDFFGWALRRQFTISAIRVKKFCSNTVFGTSIGESGFVAPVELTDALQRTIRYEFLEDHSEESLFTSE
jgi:nucleoside-diphosphate-sugar epimerase